MKYIGSVERDSGNENEYTCMKTSKKIEEESNEWEVTKALGDKEKEEG